MFSEVIAFEVLALVKNTQTPVRATSLPSVTNTLDFLLQAACWATREVAEAAAAETNIGHKNNTSCHHHQLNPHIGAFAFELSYN